MSILNLGLQSSKRTVFSMLVSFVILYFMHLKIIKSTGFYQTDGAIHDTKKDPEPLFVELKVSCFGAWSMPFRIVPEQLLDTRNLAQVFFLWL